MSEDILCTDRIDCPPAGHYSHCCTMSGSIYVSGQLPVTGTGVMLSGKPFELQAKQVLQNLEECLKAAGSSKNKLGMVRIYLTDISDWPLFNSIYAQWLGDHKPARAILGVSELHYGVSVEIEAVAAA
ncbi:RidA family protein [Mangrovibacter yixingensis]|uniref:RidA family protein n=1 Tax=Mangrovibacter yixingensis TaxID=1529639 RepID=UPI001CFA729E|nr:RidA family protein [Mangrovibacter yixingensis]